jgi:hypothetical protein
MDKQFEIKFLSDDGNKETVYIDARNERTAKDQFENEYSYSKIKNWIM